MTTKRAVRTPERKSTPLSEAKFLVNEIVKQARLPMRGRASDEVRRLQLDAIVRLGRMADNALRRHAAGKR